jgi:hypothetical protein
MTLPARSQGRQAMAEVLGFNWECSFLVTTCAMRGIALTARRYDDRVVGYCRVRRELDREDRPRIRSEWTRGSVDL